MIENKLQRIYQYLIRYKIENDGNAPSYRQIMTACNVDSTSQVHRYIGLLCAKKLIRVINEDVGGRSHKIVVVGGRWLPPESNQRQAASA